MTKEFPFFRSARSPKGNDDGEPLVSISENLEEDARNSSQRFAADRERIENPVKKAINEELRAARAKGDREREEFLKKIKDDFNFPSEKTLH